MKEGAVVGTLAASWGAWADFHAEYGQEFLIFTQVTYFSRFFRFFVTFLVTQGRSKAS